MATGLRSHIADLVASLRKWRGVARRMLRCERIRFRGIVGDQVWERDLIVAPRREWARMVAGDPDLACWSTARFGPLMLALSPPPLVVLADLD